MITTIADLLRELQAKETAKLASENIVHAPTIGAMHEGLTRDIGGSKNLLGLFVEQMVVIAEVVGHSRASGSFLSLDRVQRCQRAAD